MKVLLILLVLGAIIAAPILSHKYGYKNGYTTGEKKGFREGESKGFNEYHIETTRKYAMYAKDRKLDFSNSNVDLNYKDLIRKLGVATQSNSDSSVFLNVLQTVHTKILSQVASKLKLTKKDSAEVISTYDSIRFTISKNHFELFKKNLKNSIDTEPLFERKHYNAGAEFSKTVSENICDVVEIVGYLMAIKTGAKITKEAAQAVVSAGKAASTKSTNKVVKNGAGIFTAGEAGFELLDNFCPSIMYGLMLQLDIKFKEAGLYVDMQTIEMSFDGYLRRSIAEIATVEDVIDSIELTKQVDKKLRAFNRSFLWGKFDSKATVTLKSSARIKAGIDINDFFEYKIYPDSGKITIFVAKPKILSTEIESTVAEMENGYLIKVNEELLNQAQNDVFKKIEYMTSSSKILDDAQVNFERFFKAIILPSLRFRGIKKVNFIYIDTNKSTPVQIRRPDIN